MDTGQVQTASPSIVSLRNLAYDLDQKVSVHCALCSPGPKISAALEKLCAALEVFQNDVDDLIDLPGPPL